MKCNDIQINLGEFMDNEMNHEKSLMIKKHVQECKQCFNQTQNILFLKQQLESLKGPSLNSDFEIKLQERIKKSNTKSNYSKFLALAASIALIAPLVHYLTFQPQLNVQKQFIIELESIGKTAFDEYESFHKWTQVVSSEESLVCGDAMSKRYCSLDKQYLSRI
ncbi:hypothetical protein AX660_10710 [Paraglaciecola hydrolytica]|uniref:Zinc-finger domain-containing protein n=2 Tax=Paraglaciecola hydrolytica TaxID=1799789 RepID=A0A136A5C1_9ALTE|nr:hypothetical protein AX660_10710 [Paraglaciecola hydrolytica]